MKLGHYVFLLLILGEAAFGIWCVDLWRGLREAAALRRSTFLYPGHRVVSACLDPDVYLQFLRPRLLILGIWSLLGSVTAAVLWALGPTPFWASVILLCWLVVSSLVYMIWMTLATRRYWP